MRVLLTGRDGQVGFELQRALLPLGELLALGRADCDLADPDALRRCVRNARPDVIVNAGAYTAVDRAESEPGLAMAVNGIAPGVLGEEAANAGALVVHYSTDYVYSGEKNSPYVEDDPVGPLNEYGRTKLAGERALEASGARHWVFRTSWVFGHHGSNFVRTILRLARERDDLGIVADQRGAPTSAALIADVTAQALGRRSGPALNDVSGVFHLAASGDTTWCDYARAIVESAEAKDMPLKLRAGAIRAISTTDYPTPARRPSNSRLETRKLRDTFGLVLPSWRTLLAHELQQML